MCGFAAMMQPWCVQGSAGWERRRLLRNVNVSLTEWETTDVRGGLGGGWVGDLSLCLEVELRDRSLSARVRGLVVDAFAVALHFGQVLVEDLARS